MKICQEKPIISNQVSDTLKETWRNENNVSLFFGSFKRGFVMGSLFSVFVITFLLIIVSTNTEILKVGSDPTANKIFEIETLIEKYEYYDYNNNLLEDSLCDTLMGVVDDDYADYYSQSEFSAVKARMSGESYNYGIQLKNTTDGLYLFPTAGGPSEAAGIHSGDVLFAINGVETSADEAAASEQLKCIKGNKLQLRVLRNQEQLEFLITGVKQIAQSIKYDLLGKSTGYIEISEFTENTPEQFKKAIDVLKYQEVDSLILDVRDNPGGEFSSAIEMLDLLLPAGLLLYTVDNNGARTDIYSDSGSVEIPIVVMVNDHTISSAEVFAGVLQKVGSDLVVGENTFGKGVMQKIIMLKDGSAVRITTSAYYFPDGSSLDHIGITPDYVFHSESEQMKAALSLFYK